MIQNKGFTLVETIVVITIFSIIAAGIASSFISGMKIWGRAAEVDFVQSQVLLSLEQIAVKLRQCVNISAIGFNGSSEEFSFPGLLADDIGRIKYSFAPVSKTVFLRFQSLKDILLAQEEEETVEVKYIERKFLSADSFSARYLSFDKEKNSYGWVDEWKEEDGAPVAVGLEVCAGQNKFEKVIFIPIGEITRIQETIIK